MGDYANPRRNITAASEVWSELDEAARECGYEHTSEWLIAVGLRVAELADKSAFRKPEPETKPVEPKRPVGRPRKLSSSI